MYITHQQFNLKRINNLVSGGAGFLGSHLIDKLLAKGENVLCIDNFSTGKTDNILHLKNNNSFIFIKHDVLQPLKSEIPIDKIWHLACPASPSQYQKDPLRTIRINYEGTLNILNLAKEFKSKLLFTSTSEVYGLSNGLTQNEDMLVNLSTNSPRACYSEGKRIAETLIYVFGKVNNLQTRLARVFNTYGPRLNINDGRVISNFINQSLNKKKLTIYGDGSQTRSFCYVNDMVQGLIALMESEYSNPINLGTDQEISILNLASLIRNKINNKISLEYFDLPIDDPRFRKPCLDLAKKELGWDPKIDLSEGLEKTINYFKI